VHDEAPDNRCYDWGIGDKAAVDAAFAKRRTRSRR
jgi:carbon-monoxide dehydrogenase large subunit